MSDIFKFDLVAPCGIRLPWQRGIILDISTAEAAASPGFGSCGQHRRETGCYGVGEQGGAVTSRIALARYDGVAFSRGVLRLARMARNRISHTLGRPGDGGDGAGEDTLP